MCARVPNASSSPIGEAITSRVNAEASTFRAAPPPPNVVVEVEPLSQSRHIQENNLGASFRNLFLKTTSTLTTKYFLLFIMMFYSLCM